jgi:hypothetical protein
LLHRPVVGGLLLLAAWQWRDPLSVKSRRTGAAHTLSHELRVAKDRIEKLEAEVQLYQEKAERAQAWLGKIASEVEDRLLK